MKIITAVAFILLSFPAKAQFRGTTWGMSMEEVKSIEKSELLTTRKSDILLYKIETAEFLCDLMYKFDKGNLSEILYNFKNLDDGDVIYEHSGLWVNTISNLKSKYGAPNVTQKGVAIWKNPKYTIRAYINDPIISKLVTVSYTPPIVSQVDIL